MELVRSVDPFIPDLEYLLNSVQYVNPGKRACKKEKKLEEEIPNFSEAYLGPQIWNNTMGQNDMKLEQLDLEELLDSNNLNKELDISLLLSPQEPCSKSDSPDQNLAGNKEKEKKLEDEIPDFRASYLGPQPWNNTVGEGDMKLEQLDLEELLDDNDLNREVDMSLLSAAQEVGLKDDRAEQNVSENKDGMQYSLLDSPTKLHTPFSTASPQFNQFNNNVVPFNQASPTTTIAPASELDLVLPPMRLCELKSDSPPGTAKKDVPRFEFQTDAQEAIAKEGDSDPEAFDPRKRSFTDEELKPQPIIRKAKKVHVPDDNKDEKYWQKRVKNNVAAKRSREARRIKENQIAMRTKFLEKENSSLHLEVKTLRAQLQRLMDIIAKYEKRNGANAAR